MSRRALALVALALLLRVDLLSRPFVQYFSNREVQNAVPIRLFQEGRFTLASLPLRFTDTYGVAELQLLPLLVMAPYRALEALGLARQPAPGDAEAAARYYSLIALLGRLVSLAAVAGALVLLHAMVREAWGERPALLALLAYALLPYSRFYDQLFIAEPWLMFLSLAGLWALWRWSALERGGASFLVVAAVALALVLMLKVSHVFVGLPVAFLLWRRWRFWALLRAETWLLAATILGPALWLYKLRGSWVNALEGWALENTLLTFSDWSYAGPMLALLLKRHLWSVWTPIGAALLAMGVAAAARRREPSARAFGGLLLFWSLGWLYYWFMAGQLSGHGYYQAPSVPIAAALVGLGLDALFARLRGAAAVAATAALVAFPFAWNAVLQRWNEDDSRYWREPWCGTLLEAGLDADRRLPADAKIVAGSRAAVQYMVFYYAHRDGFFLATDNGDEAQAQAPARLEALRAQGAGFYLAPLNYDGARYNGVVFDRATFAELPIAAYLFARYPVLTDRDSHMLFDLRSPLPGAPALAEPLPSP